MDEATLRHLFEPFYPRNRRARTGLGLATVYGIVQQAAAGYPSPANPEPEPRQHYLPRFDE
jgi:hypothetical protein